MEDHTETSPSDIGGCVIARNNFANFAYVCDAAPARNGEIISIYNEVN